VKVENEELHDLYTSPDIIRVLEWKRMRRAGHLARMGQMRNTYRILIENVKE
jgi:hypothetical protein